MLRIVRRWPACPPFVLPGVRSSFQEASHRRYEKSNGIETMICSGSSHHFPQPYHARLSVGRTS